MTRTPEPTPATTATVARIAAGDRRLIARVATAIERGQLETSELLDALYRGGGHAHVIGVTGPPGGGKSTLVDQMVTCYRRAGSRVAVIAVDPSSPLTGGATLGDRYRMMRHHADDGVFVRSMANRGQPGGLAPAAMGLVDLFDIAGFDPVIVETVGIGQSDTAITALAETTLLVQAPGNGDSIQTLKAGILELGDILVVNKSDSTGASELRRDLLAMLALDATGPETAWHPPVIPVSAANGENVGALLSAIAEHRVFLGKEAEGQRRRTARATVAVHSLLRANLERQVLMLMETAGPDLIEDVASRRRSPGEAARQLLG